MLTTKLKTIQTLVGHWVVISPTSECMIGATLFTYEHMIGATLFTYEQQIIK